jgi:segregation and condensation protein A
MSNDYQIELPVFSGPLDLLLHLIERQELDVTTISLVQVTSQYLAQIERLKENRIEELIDFLVIGARLAQIKSRALLPPSPLQLVEEEEEDPAEALIRQLRRYKRFKQAAAWLQAREEAGLRTYLRLAPPPKLEGRLDLSGITVTSLVTAVQAALDRVDDLEESVAIVQPRRITMKGQINRLRQLVRQAKSLLFHELLSTEATSMEVAVTLLALLELIKRHEVEASQTRLFGPIEIVHNNDAASGDAPANSIVPAHPSSPPNNQ